MPIHVVADSSAKLAGVRAVLERKFTVTSELLGGISVQRSDVSALVVKADLRTVASHFDRPCSSMQAAILLPAFLAPATSIWVPLATAVNIDASAISPAEAVACVSRASTGDEVSVETWSASSASSLAWLRAPTSTLVAPKA